MSLRYIEFILTAALVIGVAICLFAFVDMLHFALTYDPATDQLSDQWWAIRGHSNATD